MFPGHLLNYNICQVHFDLMYLIAKEMAAIEVFQRKIHNLYGKKEIKKLMMTKKENIIYSYVLK